MLKSFFNPKTIALIGATDRKDSVGLSLAKNLSSKKVFYVNPNRKMVLGKPTYDVVPLGVDLAIIAVPSKFVISVAKQCVERKVKNIIIISSGFAEVGNVKLQEELKGVLLGNRFLGPNCMGIITSGMNASFAKYNIKKGEVAFLSQSGALINAVIKDYGFSHLVSLGNAADLSIGDFLEYLDKDAKTKVISLYLEGLKDGQRFIEAVRKISKPVVVLKGGKTELGRKAVSSHTASLAGKKEIYSAAFEKAGAFEVNNLKDLMEISLLLTKYERCENSIGIITNAGGLGVLAADWCSYYGVKVTLGPIDIGGDALPSDFKREIEKVIKKVKGLIVLQTEQGMTDIEENIKVISLLQKKYPKKPILFGSLDPRILSLSFQCLIRMVK